MKYFIVIWWEDEELTEMANQSIIAAYSMEAAEEYVKTRAISGGYEYTIVESEITQA